MMMRISNQNTLILLVTVVFCIVNSCRKSKEGPEVEWEKTYGGTEIDQAYSVQLISDGGYVIVGMTESFGDMSDDIYVVKTDAYGDKVWENIYGGDEQDWGHSIVENNDGDYVFCGHTYSYGAGNSDCYLIKTDSEGDTLWTKVYGGIGSDCGGAIKQTNDGGYIIAGYTSSFGAGSYDVWLLKTDASGDTVWTKTYGGTDDDKGVSVQQTLDGGYIIGGLTESFGAGREDIYVIKTDIDGGVIWSRTYGGSNQEWGSVRQTTDGGYIIDGWSNSFLRYANDHGDVYLIRTDIEGDTLWTRIFGGEGFDYGSDVVEAFDGGFVIVGNTNSFGAGNADVYLVKVDTHGNELWTMTIGGSGYDYGNSLQVTSDCGYIIGGITTSFGFGWDDYYLIKIGPDIE